MGMGQRRRNFAQFSGHPSDPPERPRHTGGRRLLPLRPLPTRLPRRLLAPRTPLGRPSEPLGAVGDRRVAPTAGGRLVKIDPKTPIWVVTDPTPPRRSPPSASRRPSTASGSSSRGGSRWTSGRRSSRLVTKRTRKRGAGSSSDASRHRSVSTAAFPRGEVVRVKLHDRDGTLLFEGELG